VDGPSNVTGGNRIGGTRIIGVLGAGSPEDILKKGSRRIDTRYLLVERAVKTNIIGKEDVSTSGMEEKGGYWFCWKGINTPTCAWTKTQTRGGGRFFVIFPKRSCSTGRVNQKKMTGPSHRNIRRKGGKIIQGAIDSCNGKKNSSPLIEPTCRNWEEGDSEVKTKKKPSRPNQKHSFAWKNGGSRGIY